MLTNSKIMSFVFNKSAVIDHNASGKGRNLKCPCSIITFYGKHWHIVKVSSVNIYKTALKVNTLWYLLQRDIIYSVLFFLIQYVNCFVREYKV